MNRRGFLKGLLGAAAAGVTAAVMELDPERLLWVPGQKTFFLPDAPKVKLTDEAAMRGIEVAEAQDLFALDEQKMFADLAKKQELEMALRQGVAEGSLYRFGRGGKVEWSGLSRDNHTLGLDAIAKRLHDEAVREGSRLGVRYHRHYDIRTKA